MDTIKLRETITRIKESTEHRKETDESGKDISVIISSIRHAYIRGDNTQLKNTIIKIKNSFLLNWRKEQIPFVASVVNRIDLKSGIPLPILSICGKGTQEIRFTKYLSYFLDQNKQHGLQDRLLEVILNPECKRLGLGEDWQIGCEVIPEIKLGEVSSGIGYVGCFADIGIVGNDYLIVIEQKILSNESNHPNSELNQLRRYNVALENNEDFKHKKHIKIYLTPHRKNSNSISGWINLTHGDIINRGLVLLKSSDLPKTGKENLLRLLIDLAVGPYEMVEDIVDEINVLGNRIITEEFNLSTFIRFRRLIDDNRQFIELLMEG